MNMISNVEHRRHTEKCRNVAKIKDQLISEFDRLGQELLVRDHGSSREIPRSPQRLKVVDTRDRLGCIFRRVHRHIKRSG